MNLRPLVVWLFAASITAFPAPAGATDTTTFAAALRDDSQAYFYINSAGYKTITGAFDVPSISVVPGGNFPVHSIFIYVSIVSGQTIFQGGIRALIQNGKTSYYWFSAFGVGKEIVYKFTPPSAGDQVSASCFLDSSTTGHCIFENLRTGDSFETGTIHAESGYSLPASGGTPFYSVESDEAQNVGLVNWGTIHWFADAVYPSKGNPFFVEPSSPGLATANMVIGGRTVGVTKVTGFGEATITYQG